VIEIEIEIETWLCLALLGFAPLGFVWLCLALLGVKKEESIILKLMPEP
jgi:hypothetical protein